MDRRFLSAFTDPSDQVKILGRRVSPFCLLHRIQLEAADSPLLRSDADIRPLDLLVAVKICAGEPIGKPTFRDSWYVGKMANNPDYFAEQVERFASIVLVESWPKFWEKRSRNGDATGIPWVLSVIANLIANGIPEDRAWHMPESQAIWLNSAFAVIKGAELKVLTTEEEKLIEEMDKKQ
jgi:hypothetical protein